MQQRVEHQLKAFCWSDDKLIHSFQHIVIPDDFDFDATKKNSLAVFYKTIHPEAFLDFKQSRFIETKMVDGIQTHIFVSQIYSQRKFETVKNELIDKGFNITREYAYGKF